MEHGTQVHNSNINPSVYVWHTIFVLSPLVKMNTIEPLSEGGKGQTHYPFKADRVELRLLLGGNSADRPQVAVSRIREDFAIMDMSSALSVALVE